MDEKKTLTYEEYLLGQKTAADNLAKMKLTEAQGQAQKQYESAISEADKRFARYMNPYGSSQQKIADMGLSGSGYANYLNDRAYIANITERQAASAARSEADRLAKYDHDVALAGAQADYESKYGAWLLEKENAIKGAMQGLTGLDAIKGAKALVASGDLTEDSELYRTFMKGALANIGEQIEHGTLFTKADGTQMSEAEANELLNAIDKYAPDYASAARGKLNTYTETITPKTRINENGHTLGIDEGEFASANEGDKIKVWFGSTKFKVNKGAEVTDSAVVAAAKKITAPGAVVFGLGNNLYVAYGGKAYAINVRNGDDYNSLKSFVFDIDKTQTTQQKAIEETQKPKQTKPKHR